MKAREGQRSSLVVVVSIILLALAWGAYAQQPVAAATTSGAVSTASTWHSIDDLRKAAEDGNADAQFQLGLQYAEGTALNKDLVEAYKWLQLAADQGYSKAISSRFDIALSLSPEEIAEAKRRASQIKVAQASKELTLDCGNGVSMKLVLIPAGEFMMGGDEPPEQVARKCDNVEAKAEWFQAEQPQHRVKITKSFYMGVYVVTQAQYMVTQWQFEARGVNPSNFEGKSNPVEQVSWSDAVEFCRKLSAKTGQTIRLPTEAEWEYACRAGTTTPFNTGETISTDQANYDGRTTYGSGREGEYRGKPMAVGSFAANGFRLYDMHGNVLEWCQDWYDEGYYKNSPTDDPPGPANGQSRVLRGGSWNNYSWYCRSANRDWLEPENRRYSVGFRVVCAPRP